MCHKCSCWTTAAVSHLSESPFRLNKKGNSTQPMWKLWKDGEFKQRTAEKDRSCRYSQQTQAWSDQLRNGGSGVPGQQWRSFSAHGFDRHTVCRKDSTIDCRVSLEIYWKICAGHESSALAFRITTTLLTSAEQLYIRILLPPYKHQLVFPKKLVNTSQVIKEVNLGTVIGINVVIFVFCWT